MCAAAVDRAPYADADSELRALACAAEGFGCECRGGRDGPVYRVTSLEDSGPGTLRDACSKEGPLWIVFQVYGPITLSRAVRVGSFKTLDGRGTKVILTGFGLQLKECSHVIISNLCFRGGRGDDVDAVQIKPNSRHIWIDRCTLEDYDDGLIDITRASTDITVSRCHFMRHNKTMLIGADPKHTTDRDIRVSIHHCFFDATRQRHPRLRFGKAHLYNNYTRNWSIYAVCASLEAQILSQCCIYEAGGNKKAFEYYFEQAPDRDAKESGCIASEGDVFLGGATPGSPPGNGTVFSPSQLYSKDWSLQSPSADSVVAVAGWQDIPLPPDLPPRP